MLSGEVFLDGPGETRTKVVCDQAMAIKFLGVVNAGVASGDRKDQGLAGLTLLYSDGRVNKVAVTNTGLVRIGARVVQVNKEHMMAILRQMQRECARP